RDRVGVPVLAVPLGSAGPRKEASSVELFDERAHARRGHHVLAPPRPVGTTSTNEHDCPVLEDLHVAATLAGETANRSDLDRRGRVGLHWPTAQKEARLR